MTAEKLRTGVEAVLGANAGVRFRSNILCLEVQGLSVDDNTQDIHVGFEREGRQTRDLRMKWVNHPHYGTQVPLVEVPEHVALRLLKKGRIRVGLVYCKLKLQPTRLTRCYRCHGYGQLAAEYERTNRSDRCLSCETQGHQARVCDRPSNCILYEELGRPSWNHSSGSGHCEAYRRAKVEASKKAKTDNRS